MTFFCAIALPRGINVGRAKRIAMADLRTRFEELGFTSVRTVLNSGNVVFGSPVRPPVAAAKAIEDALVERIGVVSRVTVLRNVRKIPSLFVPRLTGALLRCSSSP